MNFYILKQTLSAVEERPVKNYKTLYRVSIEPERSLPLENKNK